jgi:hypothetical protein
VRRTQRRRIAASCPSEQNRSRIVHIFKSQLLVAANLRTIIASDGAPRFVADGQWKFVRFNLLPWRRIVVTAAGLSFLFVHTIGESHGNICARQQLDDFCNFEWR